MHHSNGPSRIQHTISEETEASLVEIQAIKSTPFSIYLHNHYLMTGSEGNASKSRFRYEAPMRLS